MNTWLLLHINQLAGRNALLDGLMIFCAVYLLFGVGLILASCVIVLAREGRWPDVTLIGLTLVVGVLLLELAALWHPDHRPFMDHHLRQLVAHASGASFPSDHTTASATMAIAVLAVSRFKKTGLVMLALAPLIGFSRVFVGIHYPLDIAGGFGVAALATGLIVSLRAGWVRRRPFIASTVDHVQ